MSRWRDKLGIGASALCAIHCAATPFLIMSLPNLRLTEWMSSPWFHRVAALICAAIVAVSIVPSFRRHRDSTVLGFCVAGLVLILGSAFLFPAECCTFKGANNDTSSEAVHLVASTTSLESNGDSCVLEEGHENCAFCLARAAALKAAADKPAQESEPENAIAGFLPFAAFAEIWQVLGHWITPIGGGLLVVAHLLNLRRSYSGCGHSCGCQRPAVNSTSVNIDSLTQAA